MDSQITLKAYCIAFAIDNHLLAESDFQKHYYFRGQFERK